MNRRAAERVPVDLAITCRVPASPNRARMADVSHGGCKLSFLDGAVAPGATVNLDLPFRTVTGEVVWMAGRSAGVQFHRRLYPEAAVALGLEPPPEPEPIHEAREPVSGLRHWIRRVFGLAPR